KACVLPENPASYRVVRKKSYLFNKAYFEFSPGPRQAAPENIPFAWIEARPGRRDARLNPDKYCADCANMRRKLPIQLSLGGMVIFCG
ncbi:hypothetical protein KQE47_09825, partial [Raoultella planticola]|uniref:hypothetical protein n=1 Tax=Raoultella planticola TaxID=575 RepID=UPI00223C3098